MAEEPRDAPSSPLLPYESDFYASLSPALKEEFAQARALHDAVLNVFEPGHVTIPPEVDRRVAHTVLALVAKATKTFRAIELTCAVGADTDAVALVRVLFETAIVVEHILAPDLGQTASESTPPHSLPDSSRRRAIAYWAYVLHRALRQLEAWEKHPEWGAEKETAATQVEWQRMLDELAAQLPDRTWREHWSGKGSLKEAVASLGGTVWYKTVYAHLSSFAHANDFLAHLYKTETEDVGIELAPSHTHIRLALATARQALWSVTDNACAGLRIPANLEHFSPLTTKSIPKVRDAREK
jgi:Family of unknown function (DUF5677)